ncbi:DeoR family transcriptional regulator [Paenibacillus fonticola]|uniref:DeoR family transcriptional regulator n=1 Tax=Paenibacillus fonticola TaxID=379896 RepID=UPI0030840948
MNYVRLIPDRIVTAFAAARGFNVHGAAIRRDLAKIEWAGILKRTHNGVIMEQ